MKAFGYFLSIFLLGLAEYIMTIDSSNSMMAVIAFIPVILAITVFSATRSL